MATTSGSAAYAVSRGPRTSITTTAFTGRFLRVSVTFTRPETTGLPRRVLVCCGVCHSGRLTTATVCAASATGHTVGSPSVITGRGTEHAVFAGGGRVGRNGLAASRAAVQRVATATILAISRVSMTVKVSFRRAGAAMRGGESTKGTDATGSAVMSFTVLATSRITRIACAAVRQSKHAGQVLSLPVPLMVTANDSPGLLFLKTCLSKSIPQELHFWCPEHSNTHWTPEFYCGCVVLSLRGPSINFVFTIFQTRLSVFALEKIENISPKSTLSMARSFYRRPCPARLSFGTRCN